MKTYKNLWETFISKDNFELALCNAIQCKKKYRQIKAFLKNRDENLEVVRQMVMRGEFHTSEYRSKTIYEPKERIIYKLPFAPDRIVQHAIMNILKPILKQKFIGNSFACIEGRGQHKASLKCSEFVRRNEYCLKCDIRKFYPNIDQKILSAMIHHFIRDEKFMQIVDDVIFSFAGGKNCPIGNYCSQWFGNFYLTRLDNFVKHELKCRDYERYCDDFLLFSNDKQYLNDCKKKIEAFLYDELKLTFSKSDLFKTKQGVDFCGYRHFGKYVLLRKQTAKRTARRLRYFAKQNRKDDHIRSSIASAYGLLKHCCSFRLRKKWEAEANRSGSKD